MFTKPFLLAVSIISIANSEEIAYVDLTAAPSVLSSGSRTTFVRGGGILYHGTPNHASPGTPTLALRITRLIANGKAGPSPAVEVTATNVGKTAVTIPVGSDTSTLLKSSEKGRRYLVFSVSLTGSIQVGTAVSACNAGHSETSLSLQPGGQVAFLLPMNTGSMVTAGKDVSISVQLYEKVDDKGKEWEQLIGDPIKSSSFPLQ